MTPRRYIACAGVLLVLGLAGVARGQTTSAPTLSDVDRLSLQNLALVMEVAKLRAEVAQRDYDQARERLRALVQAAERPGYVLDLQTLTYQPAPASHEAPR